MLSYQHSYHAGNLADVQKHVLLAWMLDYLTQKDKPLSYVETHSGRGLYDLAGPEAEKTGEAAQGIARLEAGLPADHPYCRSLAGVRARHGDHAYPGSPLLAAMGLREGDVMHLAELHPQEHAALTDLLAPWGAHIQKRDGFEMALAVTPPTPRRGLMLIDPSYEVKADYQTIPKFIGQVARKWNVGIIALWYPILTDAPHRPMLDALMAAHPGALRHEVRFPPVRAGHRMVGSGFWVLNPPFGMDAESARLDALFKGGADA
ncbi:23S rRNA (adenine(2030)-N(6))-methyltransferase RlmJ [Paragemmobacter ruber]|uniref:Ribosomal RNA large subunit methyltransferase J n=1 Tax=Paragemmobacter ruber TaxID=1985673 RepID=A0ABW9Y1F6_9RHOB|nr:23S rRNA (adenine(2030)-N(6))-methyltransferase RlmJ [Rhodobacter ruber]NBE06343.1 23S rRNA (adenine(2030)-N(6))-methyltransferase RlmJ [Rhodobacter ruber]